MYMSKEGKVVQYGAIKRYYAGEKEREDAAASPLISKKI